MTFTKPTEADAAGRPHGRGRTTRQVLVTVLIGLASIAGYTALWRVQRTLATRGFSPLHVFQAFPREGVDGAGVGTDLLDYFLLAAALTALFLALVILSRRWHSRPVALCALAMPVLVAVGLFLAVPTLSIDTYSYLANGYIADHGENPYLVPLTTFGHTGYGQALGAFGWLPVHPASPYGPVWTLLERIAVGLAGDDVGLGIRLIRVPTLLAVLGTGALLWNLLGRIAPGSRLTGTLLFLANPLVLIELAGEGHNDALVLFFLTLMVWGCARRRPAVAVVAVGLAALVKPTAAVFLLPLAAHLIGRWRMDRRPPVEAAGALAGTAILGVVLYAPYWSGAATFQGLTATEMGPAWSIAGLVSRLVAAVGAPASVATGVLGLLLLGGALALGRLAGSLAGVIASCAALATLELLLLPVYWPWYSSLPLPFLALSPTALDIGVATLLAAGSRISAPVGPLAVLGITGYGSEQDRSTLCGLTIPAVVALPPLVVQAVRVARNRTGSVRTAAHQAPSPATGVVIPTSDG